MIPGEPQFEPYTESAAINQPYPKPVTARNGIGNHSGDGAVAGDFSAAVKQPAGILSKSVEQAQIRILLASYSDILFVIMPFLLVLTLKLFNSTPLEVLASPEWALASAVLAGLAVVKLMLGLVSHDKMSNYRERLVFMVAATTFLLLMPSLLLAGTAYVMATPPWFLVYVHPVLLIVAIAVYS
jgi:hypothetical protein